MAQLDDRIAEIETLVERALWDHEASGDLHSAAAVYQRAITDLSEMPVVTAAAGRSRDKVLAYALMRHANVLRQTGDLNVAKAQDEAGLDAARRNGDSLAIGRILLSMAGTAFASAEQDVAFDRMAEARSAFDDGTSDDHIQGAGWTWVLEADAVNAGLAEGGPDQAIAATEQALALLRPIGNWPGVARALEAKAHALDARGDAEAALGARTEAEQAAARIDDTRSN